MTSLWQRFRAWQWWLQALLWIFLFPFVFSVWILQTTYPLWVRATAAGAVLLLFGFALFADSSDDRQLAAATQPQVTTLTQTVTVVETVEAEPAETVAKVSPPPAPRTYLVSDVIDGDTIRLEDGTRVRLVQIDAPEVGGGECFSRKAKRELTTLLPPGEIGIRLRFDPRLDKTDQYGRRLAYVFKGKELINLTLVQRGAASAFFYRGVRGQHATKLDAAAREARAARRGLWGACSATEYDPMRAIAARPPAPPVDPAPLPAPAPVVDNCHPSYEGACLDPNASDYDCAGGSGNGPLYTGFVRVVGYDEYGLDADGDGQGCE